MSDAAVETQAAAPAKAAQKKKTVAKKPKVPAAHPKYAEMIAKAVASLKERGGSSRQAILKYIISNYKVGTDEKMVNSRVKLALKAGVKSGALKQSKGTGAAGSFRIGETKKADKPKKTTKPKSAAKKPKKTKKPKAAGDKKKAKPKKAAAKKPAKKADKPKKTAKPTKKTSGTKLKPKKAAAKPKVKKTTKPAAKKSAKK